MKNTLLSKALLMLCCAAWGSVVHADELADAARFQDAKNYPQAQALYTRLAKAGNAEAQLALGELYGFGDGMPEDLKQAEFWIGKAAAQGQRDAPAALKVMQARAARKTDIAYYTTAYDGREVKLDCVAPALPAVSTTNAEIHEVSSAFNQWQDCYNGFTARLNAALPAGKAIPPDLVGIMSNDEFARSSAAMDKVYAAIGAQAGAVAAELGARHQAWRGATELYVKGQSAQMQADYEQAQRQMAAARNNRVNAGENAKGR